MWHHLQSIHLAVERREINGDVVTALQNVSQNLAQIIPQGQGQLIQDRALEDGHTYTDFSLLFLSTLTSLYETAAENLDVKNICLETGFLYFSRITHIMDVLLLNEDPFMRHAAGKCLVAWLAAGPSEIEAKALIRTMWMQGFHPNYVGVCLHRCMEFASKILSSRFKQEGIQKLMVTVIQENWLPLSQINLHCGAIPNQAMMLPFLSLWKKLCKLTMTHSAIQRSDHNPMPNGGQPGTNGQSVEPNSLNQGNPAQLGHLQHLPFAIDLLFKAQVDRQGCLRVLKLLKAVLSRFTHNLAGNDLLRVELDKIAVYLLVAVEQGMLDKLPYRHGFSGFGGQGILKTQGQDDETTRDERLMANISLLVMQCAAMVMEGTHTELAVSCLYRLWRHLQAVQGPGQDFPHCLFALLSDQDDYLVQALLAMLDAHLKFLRSRPPTHLTLPEHTNPHCLFYTFLHNTAFDHQVLVDLLTSTETCFLEYFTRYLRLVSSEWSQFLQVHSTLDTNRFKTQSDKLDMDDNTQMSADMPGSSRGFQSSCLRQKRPANDDDEEPPLKAARCGSSFSLPHKQSSNGDNQMDMEDTTSHDIARTLPPSVTQLDRDSPLSMATSTSSEAAFDSSSLDQTMSVLIRLHLYLDRLVSKGLFPFNAKPLLKLLQQCDALYEQ